MQTTACDATTASTRPVYRATWHGAVLAESDATVVVEGNHYFPRDCVRDAYLRPSSTTTRCAWKGIAGYYDVVVDGAVNADAAWYYPEPTAAAQRIAGRVAFWHRVRVAPARDADSTESGRATPSIPARIGRRLRGRR